MKQAQCNVYKSVSFEPDIAYMWYSSGRKTRSTNATNMSDL